ncbi:hypothetical protein CRG98_010694 [Punica granatum]|uniref:Uncharacterized protein n=1 Tax=Punica granatum TaxID=22663 RepID=A0A2I0KK80_PUNGR|nr:hypothetical protein CRG98_010694 [Punica granatum]
MCTGVHKRGREFRRATGSLGARSGARQGAQEHGQAHGQARTDERGQARWSSTDIRMCMRMPVGDVRGARVHGRGREQARAGTRGDKRSDGRRTRSDGRWRAVTSALYTREHGPNLK